MAELIKNPSMMEKAQVEVRRIYKGRETVDESEIHELKYLSSVVKETLRLHPPGVLLLPRESIGRCVINGYEIPEKTRIMVNAWAIGRDPRHWDEADTFKPERFLGTDKNIDFKGNDFELIPFGAGRRGCPAITFSIAVIELALAQLLHSFDWELPPGISAKDLDLTEVFGISMHRRDHLYVVAKPNSP